MSISSILETVKITSGAAKIEELKKANSPLFNSIFADCYGPQTYGIMINADAIANDGDSGILTIDADYEVFHKMLDSLATRKVTGFDARILAAKTIHQFVGFDKKWLAAILNRDLGIGVSYATYLKEIAKTGEKPYEVTLAFNLDKAKNVNALDGTYYASRKCDGCVSGDTLVEVDGVGILPISEVVEKKLKGKIKSMELATGEVVYSDIVDWMHNVPDFDSAHKDWFLLELEDGRTLKITGNDSVYVKERGWTRADSLKEGDELLTGT